MSDNPIQVPIQYTVDTSKAQPNLENIAALVEKTRQSVEAFAKKGGLDQIGKSNLDAVTRKIDDLEGALTISAGKARLLETAISEVGDSSSELDDLTRRLSDVQNEAQDARRELEKIPGSLEDIAAASRRQQGQDAVNAISGLGSFEGIFTNTRGLVQSGGGVLGVDQKRLQGVSTGLELAGDIAGTVDAIPRAIKGFQDLRASIVALQASGVLSAGALGTAAVSLAGVAIAAYAVSKAYSESVEVATAPVEAFLNSLDKVNVSQLDAGLITTREQLERLRAENEAYAATLTENIDKTKGFVDAAESSNNVLLRGADTLGLGQYENAVNDAKGATEEYNTQLETVQSNLDLLNSGLIEISISAREATAAITGELALARERSQLLRTSTQEDLKQRRTDAEIQLQATNQVIETTRRQAIELLTEQVAAFFPEVGEALQAVPLVDQIKFLQDLVADEGQNLAPGLQELISALAGLQGQSDQFTKQIELYNNPLLQAAIKAREAETAELEANKKALEETTKAEEKRRDSLAKATGDYQDAVTSLEQFQRSVAEKTAERQRDAQRDSIRDDLRRQIDAAKQVEAEQERLSKLNQARIKATQDIQATERKLQAENVKAAAEYAKQRQQAERDLADSLQEAALDNDVNAFLSAKKAGEKELDRLDDEYQTQKREREAQARETTNNILRQLQEQERAELTQRANTITRSLQLEQQLARLEEQWRVQDAQRRLQLEQQASNDRLRLLQNEVIQARNIIRLLQNPVQRQTAVNQATNAVISAFQGVGNAFSFADGGIATRPTLAIVGDKPGYAEAMIPFRPSEGIGRAAARAGLGNVTLNLTQIIGEVASPKDIESARTEIFNAILEAKRLEYAEVV